MPDRVVETFARWRLDPRVFVRECFGVEPDPWQDEVLVAFPGAPRIALCAAKGPGKTALEAWLAWNMLATRPQSKVGATSITGANLRDNLWAEMSKWQQRSEFLQAYFEWTGSRIFCKQAPETWFMSARTWPKDADPQAQAETLAGLHADYIAFFLDESGGIPDAVMVAAEATLASCIEGHIVQAGNPTHLSGPLYRATRDKNWLVFYITGDPDDPKRASRISVEWARQMIETYGRHDPWVLVNVFGQFPPSSINALLGPEDVEAAMSRHYNVGQYGHAPRILGVDVARFGDDKSVIFPRQGLVAFEPKVYRSLDSMQGAALVARQWEEWKADGCFVDETGGYGAGWIDAMRQLGRSPVGVHFAGKALDPRYANRRAEMHFKMAEWVKEGGALPPSAELRRTLPAIEYTFKGDQMMIEPKDELKARLGFSPDEADGLCLTFAAPVAARSADYGFPERPRHQIEYEPYAELYRAPVPRSGGWR